MEDGVRTKAKDAGRRAAHDRPRLPHRSVAIGRDHEVSDHPERRSSAHGLRLGPRVPRLHLTGIAVAAAVLSWVLITYGVIGPG